MPIGPFAPIPATSPPQKIRLEHINEMRVALSNLADAYDVAVAEGFTGTRAEWLASLQGPPGAGTQAGETAGEAVAGIALSDGAGGAVETWLGTTADGGPTTYAVTKLNAAGVGSGGGAVSSVNGQTGAVVLTASDVGALSAGSAVAGLNLLEPHTFPGYAYTGDEWEATTYSGYIAGIDAKLASEPTVTKTQIALSNSTPVWAYHYGPATAPHALIVGGVHGNESYGAFGAMRFFTEYVTAGGAAMAGLRDRVQITFIPWLAADAYRFARNVSGVDLNRNFPFMWDYSTSSVKGSAPLSRAETAALKTLLDGSTIACVIDCHTGSTGDPALATLTHRGWSAGGEGIAAGALGTWEAIYNTEGHTGGEYAAAVLASEVGLPNIANWAQKYLRFHLERPNAAVVNLESDPALTGSVQNDSITADGVRLYAGYIHCYLVAWLTAGQAMEPMTPATWAAAATSAQTITATATPLTLDVQPNGDTAETNAWLDVPLRAPGSFTADVFLQFQANAAQTTAGRVEVSIGWGQSPAAGGNLTPLADSTRGWVELPTASGYATYHRSYRLEDTLGITDDDPLYRFQVFLDRIAGDADPSLLAATVTITHHPDALGGHLPVADRSS